MLLQQDPFKQFKDLSMLKDQLEDIQRRVENDVQVGVPQADTFSNQQYFGSKNNNLVSLPHLGWKCPQFSLPQGFFGRVRGGKVAVLCSFGSSCRDLHGHLRCSELSSAKHRADHERLLQFVQEGAIGGHFKTISEKQCLVQELEHTLHLVFRLFLLPSSVS